MNIVEEKRAHLFWGFLFLFVIVTASMGVLGQRCLFFWSGDYLGNDFFNVMRYIAERDPYNNTINGVQEKLYLPLSYMLLYPFTYLVDYTQLSLEDCWINTTCLVSYACFTILSLILWALSIVKLLDKYKIPRSYTLLLIFTSIFFYSIERGNLIVIAAALVNFYICYYDSNDKIKKSFALICISIASVLKIFPAALILLTIRRKEYKFFITYVIVSALLSFLPFLFFKGGFDNFALMIRNVSMQTEQTSILVSPYKYGLSGLCCNAFSFLKMTPNMAVIKIVNYCILVASVVAVFAGSKKYILALVLCIPAVFQLQAFAYNAIYILPTILIMMYYFKGKEQLWYLALFFVLSQPIQIVYHNFSFSYFFSNCALVAFWISTIYLSIKNRNNEESDRFLLI